MQNGVNLSKQTLADYITSCWGEWTASREGVVRKWKEVESYIYATDTNHTTNHQDGHGHTTHLPLVMEIKQDLESITMATLIPHDDWFIFRPANREESSLEKKEAVESYLKNLHRRNGFNKTAKTLISDLITYGVNFSGVRFENHIKGRNIGFVGPMPYRISPYDIAFNPAASDFDTTPKIIREILSISEFVKKANSGTTNWSEDAIRKVLENRNNGYSTDVSQKNQQFVPAGFNSYESYFKSGVVEMLTYYGDIFDSNTMQLHENREIVVVDSSIKLSDTEIDTPTGLPYIYMSGWESKPDNLYSMGPLENILGLNYQINHRENGKSDALDKMIDPDQLMVGEINAEFDESTGKTIWRTVEGGDIKDIVPDASTLSYDNQIDRLSAQARRSARLPGELTGFRSEGEKTAFEVGGLIDGAMRGHIHKAQDMEVNLLEPLLQAEAEIARDNLIDTVQVTAQTSTGTLAFINVTPEDLNVTGSLKPQGAKRFARRNQIISTLSQLSSTPIFQVAQPHISAKGAAKLLEELTEMESASLFSENAQIFETVEQQSLANNAERMVSDQAAQPNLQDDLLDAEIEQLQQGDLDEE